MNKNLMVRHYIGNADQLHQFEAGVERMHRALARVKEQGYDDVTLGLKLTVDPEAVNRDKRLLHSCTPGMTTPMDSVHKERERLHVGAAALDSHVVELYDPEDRGPGMSVFQIYFQPTFLNAPGVMVDVPLLGYDFYSDDGLDHIVDLARKVEADGTLYATGSRNLHPDLGVSDKTRALRNVHELYHSSAMADAFDDLQALRVSEGEQLDTAHPAFRAIGESTGGINLVNQAHHNYGTLTQRCIRAAQKIAARGSKKIGFAGEYLVALVSAQLSDKPSTGYILLDGERDAKRYGDITEEDQVERWRKLVVSQTREMIRGDEGTAELLERTLKKGVHVDRLGAFFDRDLVTTVRDWMRAGFTDTGHETVEWQD